MDFKGKRVLVVEDDYNLARDLCDEFRRRGATVLGPAPTPFYAQCLLGRRHVDDAILDVRLHGTSMFELAEDLVRRGTRIVFATALGRDSLPERYRGFAHVQKPYDAADIIKALSDEASARSQAVTTATPAPLHPEDHTGRLMRSVAGLLKRDAQGRSGSDLQDN